jgi:hypothetical protein
MSARNARDERAAATSFVALSNLSGEPNTKYGIVSRRATIRIRTSRSETPGLARHEEVT